MARSTYVSWYRNLPIPWLVAGPNGQAEGGTWPSVLDTLSVTLDSARKASFPDYAPNDALPNLGGDRKLVRGPGESKPNLIVRLKGVWDDWARAGTWLELLVQLYWAGFTGAVIVQQNGLAYQLSGAPTPGADPTGLLVITTCSALSVALTSSVTPPTAAVPPQAALPGRAIPALTPWWQFAESASANPRVSDTDYCNRFAILFPGTLPTFFRTWATATFTASDTAAIVWNNAFPTSSYAVEVGAPTITDGGGGVLVWNDPTAQTTTGGIIRASGAFTGTADVLAYIPGTNPLANLHPADLSRLQFCIGTWKPNALCVGVYAVGQGSMYGWPFATWATRGVTGPATIVRFEGA